VILVFITNVLTREDKARVSPALDHLLGAGNWHIDLGDVERVLRVESATDITVQVLHLLNALGYEGCLM
jgi:hypothetical protein